jgi:hypothetical protein
MEVNDSYTCLKKKNLYLNELQKLSIKVDTISSSGIECPVTKNVALNFQITILGGEP